MKRKAGMRIYQAGFGRTSCMKCIFGSSNQWATIQVLDPAGLEKIAGYEKRFGVKIHRKESVMERAKAGAAYAMAHSRWAEVAMRKEYKEPVFLDRWECPAGAFGESCGPI